MTLQNNGPLSASQIKNEFAEKFPNNPFDINNYRGRGYPSPQIPSTGPITFSNFYGKSFRQVINLTYANSTNNINVYNDASPYFISGIPATINVIVNSGVVIGSNSTASYALTIPNSSYPTDGSILTKINVYNYGYIVGAGGAGGAGNCGDGGGAGGNNGGNALLIQYATRIFNYGTIAGGGGGGGGGGGDYDGCGKNGCCRTFCGGGGGGGAGSIGGAGGFGGQGNGGGTGSLTSGGYGGGSGGSDGCGSAGGGGTGGGLGSPGNNGASGGPSDGGGPGGSPGFYINGNSNVTWAVTGTLAGQVA